jgi:hypothetical protein
MVMEFFSDYRGPIDIGIAALLLLRPTELGSVIKKPDGVPERHVINSLEMLRSKSV